MIVNWLTTMNGNVKDEKGNPLAILDRRPQVYGPGHITVLEFYGDSAAKPFTVLGQVDSDEEVMALVADHYGM